MNKITLENIEEEFANINSQMGIITGKFNILDNQVTELEEDIEDLKETKELETKAVELINLAQKVTREKTRAQFEKLVTYTIQYIFEDDRFQFALEFDRRGSMGTLYFNLKTPELQEKANILDTDSGGLISIVSLALRLVIIESLQPKNTGFLLFDESFEGLSEDYLSKAGQFLSTISKKLNRQIIMITHQESLKTFADHTVNI